MCNRTLSRIFGGALSCLVAALPALASAAPAEPSWKTVAASGQVEARMALEAETPWQRVGRGDELVAETALRTGRAGRATLTRDAHILIVDPDSQLVLPVVSGRASSVSQTSGSVIYQVERGKTGRFEVVTPYLVAGVKGTVFEVTVGKSRTSVTVAEGSVEVISKAGERIDLHAGETAVLEMETSAGMQLHRASDGDRALGERVAARVREARLVVMRSSNGPEKNGRRSAPSSSAERREGQNAGASSGTDQGSGSDDRGSATAPLADAGAAEAVDGTVVDTVVDAAEDVVDGVTEALDDLLPGDDDEETVPEGDDPQRAEQEYNDRERCGDPVPGPVDPILPDPIDPIIPDPLDPLLPGQPGDPIDFLKTVVHVARP